ncbi:MAG: dTDP-4-dehydrorhamnose reductase [Kiritimatiellae bacterium]|nr:dTDP-4-dehydrorhamnose reductase [Kiritimatiellia bacterium]
MKVTIFGARGMLGVDLVAACSRAGMIVQGFDLPTLNVTDYDSVWSAVQSCDWVVNCAAYTHVDGAEANRDQAFAVNAEGARNVARACAKRKCRLLHISTDYVFDGHRSRPYRESDTANPLGIYGASKLAGEKAIRAEGGDFLIVRTQSLFGVHGHNFVKVILARLAEPGAGPLKVVKDQVSSPTYTPHLAEALVRLLKLDKTGIVHVSASGQCSWYDFARAIAEQVKSDVSIEPVTSADLGRTAIRPAYSVLDKRLFRMWTGHELPAWQEGLAEYMKEME